MTDSSRYVSTLHISWQNRIYTEKNYLLISFIATRNEWKNNTGNTRIADSNSWWRNSFTKRKESPQSNLEKERKTYAVDKRRNFISFYYKLSISRNVHSLIRILCTATVGTNFSVWEACIEINVTCTPHRYLVYSSRACVFTTHHCT